MINIMECNANSALHYLQIQVLQDNWNNCNKEDINKLKYLGVCYKKIYHQHSKVLFRFVIANIV